MYARIGTADRSSTGKFDDYRSLRYTRATRPKNDSVIEILWLFFISKLQNFLIARRSFTTNTKLKYLHIIIL